jgi:hypothetical protein
MAARVSSARPTEEELRFGFTLGSFNAIPKAPGGGRIRTPFVVVYNLVDNTVWLVFNPFDYDRFGEVMSEEWPKEQQGVLWEHPHRYLPPTQQHHPAFDVVKIMESGEIFRLGAYAEYTYRDRIGENKHRLFGQDVTQSAGRKFLITYRAYSSDFEKAVPKRAS